MLILTILLSLALAALFTLLPARIHHRRPACADLYAGAGVSALVWLWAVCVWSKPGLSVGFDAFRLAAIVIMQAIACGAVCGFRLRGSYSTPFRTLYLQMPENSYLAVRLRQELLAGSDVTIVNTPSEAEAILELLSDSRSRDVLSINDTGRAREYEITLSLSFRVSNPSGIDYMEAVTLTASRDLTYSESDFLSREKEEAFLYRDMEADLVNQLMRRIEAIKPPKQAGG